MDNDNLTISLSNGIACNPEYRLNKPIDFFLSKGQQLAIIGPNGAGKSLLINTLLGKFQLMNNETVHFYGDIEGGDIRYITFRDSYGSSDASYYYQQRWNSTEIEDSPIISNIFPKITGNEWKRQLFEFFNLSFIWKKQLVTLSSGEMRKYQLAKSLAGYPKVLIIDSPFIGLDISTREALCKLLERLAVESKIQIITVISRSEDIAPFITHVLTIEDKKCGEIQPIKDFLSRQKNHLTKSIPTADIKKIMKSLPSNDVNSEEIICCNNVTLKYNKRVILDNLCWTINKGEHWALLGPNGAGKSALLSLIYADNPQSYACNIALFGRKRGSGESIWDIKKHIGYVSPEMHRSYCRHIQALDIVASGLHDSIGLYKKITNEERESCRIWMKVFGVCELESKDFFNLSSGEQRIILLARAFVKNPALLILDEPLHGLDEDNRTLTMEIIKTFCSIPGKTLIIVTHYPEELPSEIDHIKNLTRHDESK
jgi:molybdate transport system ATP-binding protein